jgi:uncharacterized protein (TIGR03083 family)
LKPEETWKWIHLERSRLDETLEALAPEQWTVESWCEGWSVHQTVGHVVAAAKQTYPNFFRELASAGFKLNVFADRGARHNAQSDPAEHVRRLRARTTTTNLPPAPVVAMLGEIVVHGEDIRRPLSLTHQTSEHALIAVAGGWKNSNLLIGSKRKIAGLRLRATDVSWVHGDGPEVSGPLQSLVLAMTGRKGSHVDLTGEGLPELTKRP